MKNKIQIFLLTAFLFFALQSKEQPAYTFKVSLKQQALTGYNYSSIYTAVAGWHISINMLPGDYSYWNPIIADCASRIPESYSEASFKAIVAYYIELMGYDPALSPYVATVCWDNRY
jgi:hypothetical protein